MVKDIQNGTGGTNAAIVKEIIASRPDFDSCKISFENRKSNFEAHNLARFALSLSGGRYVWLGSPHDLVMILMNIADG